MTDKTTSKPTSTRPPRSASGERQTLEKVALTILEELRRARRWKIGLRIAYFFLFALVAISLITPSREFNAKPMGARVTALVDMDGVIAANEPANADSIITGLRSAFADKSTAGVIFRVNSPGGSPVQSRYIYDEIKRLRQKYPKVPLYAVVTDMCASGCYYAVAAADKIYASPGSIVGSIGVLMDGFGFTEAMKKLGVERRLYTAGEHKGALDPFSPVKPEERAHVQRLLNEVHGQFIQAVRAGRGKALKESKDIFSGLFWTGDQAKTLGLVDDFGSASSVAREVIGAEDIVDYSFRESVFDRFARQFGAAMARDMNLRLFGPVLK